jgi:hypothetical protein
MPRFSAPFRAAMEAGQKHTPYATVAWPSGTKHYGVSPARVGGVVLESRLLGGAAVSSAMPTKPGQLSIPDSSMKLADADGDISRLLSAGQDPAGCACSYTWAMAGVDPADWFTLMDGLFAYPSSEDGGYSKTINIRANDAALQGDADKILFLPAEFPKAPPATWQTFFPFIYGSHSAQTLHGKGMVKCIPWSIDATEGYRVTPTMGHAAAVPRVYKNGTLLTLSTDYDLSYPIRGKLFTSIDLAAAITADDIITCDIDGMTDVYDGTGNLITNMVDQLRHWLANRAFGNWRVGPWLNPESYPIDLQSLSRAAQFASAFCPSGSMRLGGSATAEKIPNVLQKWFSTGLCFRPFWSETSEFGLVTIDHRFMGPTSPGFPSDADAVVIHGDQQEIGTTFDDSDDVSNLINRVNLQALFGMDGDGKTYKSFQNIALEDVSQPLSGAESYEMAYSEAVLT